MLVLIGISGVSGSMMKDKLTLLILNEISNIFNLIMKINEFI